MTVRKIDTPSTTDEINVLLRFFELEREHGRHHERQRTLITNIINIVSFGIFAFITNNMGNISSLFFSAILVLLGIHGWIVMLKISERARRHFLRADRYRARIDEVMPSWNTMKIRNDGDDDVLKHYGKWIINYRLVYNWLAFDALILFVGIISFVYLAYLHWHKVF